MDQTIHNRQPLVSIVMCAYNGLPYIKEAVACVLNQTYINWELVIGDDGSNDGTREWLQQKLGNNPRVKLFFHEKNLGYVGNKNFLHQQASGTYITQLDNDDTTPVTRLQKQIDVVLANPDIKIVAGSYERIDDEGNVYSKTGPLSDIIITEKPSDGYPFWFPSLFVHRSVFEKVGYFEPYFAGALGDDIYWTAKANIHYPIYCLKDTLYGYRNNPNSITNDYSSVRKLIMPAVLNHLFEQQKNSGNDSLERKEMDKLQLLETRLVNNKRFMAEQYRIWAAKAIDKGDKQLAWNLLKKAFNRNPFNKDVYRTLVYALRK